MKTFVISLTEAKERQAHITKMMAARGLGFEFFTAVDGRGFDVPTHPAYDVIKRRLYFGRDLKGGELGVLLSHRGIYQKMVDEKIEIALVLEDDVELYPDAPQVIEALEDGPRDFELVRFLGSKKVAKLQQYSKRTVLDSYSLNRLCTTPGGAHAYVITLSGAQKMLAATRENFLPIDTLMGHCWSTGVDAYIIQPGLSKQDADQPQYIGEARFDKSVALNGWMKLAFPLTRSWFKLCEGAMKRIYYYGRKLNDKKRKITNGH